MQTAIDNAVSDGERLARGHHLLALRSGEKEAKLDHAFEVEFGRVENNTCMETYAHDGTADVTENQNIYIKLHNGGNSTLFVSVFDVDVAGQITLVSASSPGGIKLTPGESYILGKEHSGNGIEGLKVSWSGTIPNTERAEETLVFILSSEDVSLRHLADPKLFRGAPGRMSNLESITYHLASGQARDLQSQSQGRCIRYALHHIPFSLRTQQPLQAEEILASTSVIHSEQAAHGNNLGTQLSDRYKRTGNIDDLDAAITRAEEALAATPLNYSGRAMYLNNLGVMLSDRYMMTGNADDLDAAITRAEEALAATWPNYSAKPAYLNNLSTKLSFRYRRTGNPEYLDEAISKAREAVLATPLTHSNLAAYLSNLGSVLSEKFETTRNISDLTEAISTANEVLAATPLDHSDRAAHLNDLSTKLSYGYRWTGSQDYLDEAISKAEEAVATTPLNHADRAAYLNNLGDNLRMRYEQTGALNDHNRITELGLTISAKPDIDADETSTTISTSGTVFSRTYASTRSSRTAGEVERFVNQDPVKIIPYSAKMKQVFFWVDEQLQRQVFELTAEPLRKIQLLERTQSMEKGPRNANFHLQVYEKTASQDTQRFLQVMDETIRKDCQGRSDTDPCEATFRIVWQLQQCMKDELDGSHELGPVLTISGDSSHSWAVSCREYVQTTWPTHGMTLLEKIELALSRASEAEASGQ